MDHKISVMYGFLNNKPVNEIADIKNLCITKNILNCQKGSLNENEYKIKYQTF
jgi:hypothetical protein